MADRNQNLFDLTGTNVLLTGGGQGLGKAMALGMARQGANVAILEINPKAGQEAAHEIAAVGVRSLAIPGDVADAVKQFRRVHCLINNAGAHPYFGEKLNRHQRMVVSGILMSSIK